MYDNLIEKVLGQVSVIEVIEVFGGKLDRHHKMLCPFHQEKTPSFSVDVENNRWRCFGCGKSGDAVAYVALLYDINMYEAAKRIADKFNISYDDSEFNKAIAHDKKDIKAKGKAQSTKKKDDIDKSKGTKSTIKPTANETAKDNDIDKDISSIEVESSSKNIGDEVQSINEKQVDSIDEKSKGMDELEVRLYLEKCHNNVDKTNYFALRGLSDATISEYKLGYDVDKKCVTIPYSDELRYYQTRSVTDKKYYKMRTGEDGEPIFNGERIKYGRSNPLFVVESPICAMSIEQCGPYAVATTGTSGWRRVANEIIKNRYRGGVILCFDNDEAGEKASSDMAKALVDANIEHIAVNIAGKYKDPNEMMLANLTLFEANLRGAKMDYEDKYEKNKNSRSAEDLMDMVIPPKTWLVEGLLPTGCGLLVGKPKVGKSWFVLELCAAIATGSPFLGHETRKSEVLYYALEDNDERLQRRIRTIAPDMKKFVRNFHYAFESNTIHNGLYEQLQKEVIAHPDIKLIVIDTLGIVRDDTGNKNVYQADTKDIGIIKRFADRFDVCVIFVHHDRKASDMDDVYNNINGSKGLNGAGDTLMFIAPKNRSESQMSLYVKGRDVGEQRIDVVFDKKSCKWLSQSDARDIIESEKNDLYDKNPYVNVIRHLVNVGEHHRWVGTATNLKEQVFNLTGQEMPETAATVGKLITKFENLLRTEGIMHTAVKGKDRVHIFAKLSSAL